jgi:hypothetical protein
MHLLKGVLMKHNMKITFREKSLELSEILSRKELAEIIDRAVSGETIPPETIVAIAEQAQACLFAMAGAMNPKEFAVEDLEVTSA